VHLVDTCGVVSARLEPDVFSENPPDFACAFVTNFSMNYELRTMNSLRDHLRKGVARSLSKTRQNSAIFANFSEFFEIFPNFCKFLPIFPRNLRI